MFFFRIQNVRIGESRAKFALLDSALHFWNSLADSGNAHRQVPCYLGQREGAKAERLLQGGFPGALPTAP